MQAVVENITDDLLPRDHPYDGAVYDSCVQYYDFLSNPELIREVLEDFKSLEKYDSINSFYTLLEWINRGDGKFESTDCRIRVDGPSSLQGRLMIQFRDIRFNYAAVDGKQFEVNTKLVSLATWICEDLSGIEGNVSVQVFFMPTYYRFSIPPGQFGQQLMIQYDCFAESEAGRIREFGNLVDALSMILKDVETEY